LEGYKHALSDNNLIFKDEYVISGQSSEEVKLKMLDIMELNNPPDGIFAISDLTLVGVMQALYEKDIKIPEQISVIGFSEVPFSTMYKPPVSSIRPMGNEIGRKAAEIILERIKSPCETRTKSVNYIPGDLIVRGST
jgi:LacI family transcriptional regulator